MKHPGIDGGFWICFGLNVILTARWSIPAWILLACHFVFGISLWWFVGALALWLLGIFLMVCFFSWLSAEGARTAKPPMTAEQKEARKKELAEKARVAAADFEPSFYSAPPSAKKDAE